MIGQDDDWSVKPAVRPVLEVRGKVELNPF